MSQSHTGEQKDINNGKLTVKAHIQVNCNFSINNFVVGESFTTE